MELGIWVLGFELNKCKREIQYTKDKSFLTIDGCVPLVGQGRVSPHWPGPGPRGADNGQCLQPTVCCYPGPDLAPANHRTERDGGSEGAVAVFLTRLVNHKSHTFGELIEIQIVNCLSGCCKILLFPYFAILALDMASPIKILFNFACYQRKRGSFDNT